MAHQEAPWVLTLGDGSLSFSNCLASKFNLGVIPVPSDSASGAGDNNGVKDTGAHNKKQKTTDMFLVATTFDSPASLVLKYTDALGYRTRIQSKGGVVLGSVDATNIVNTLKDAFERQALHHYSPPTSSPVSLAFDRHSSTPLPAPLPRAFDLVIFNNPHSGEESFVRHGILLRHFFHSVQSVLAPKGQVVVALCDDQPQRWQLCGNAYRLGFICVTATVMREADWPGYVHKRHQSAGSFPVQVMCAYTFVRAVDFASIDSTLITNDSEAAPATVEDTEAGDEPSPKRVCVRDDEGTPVTPPRDTPAATEALPPAMADPAVRALAATPLPCPASYQPVPLPHAATPWVRQSPLIDLTRIATARAEYMQQHPNGPPRAECLFRGEDSAVGLLVDEAGVRVCGAALPARIPRLEEAVASVVMQAAPQALTQEDAAEKAPSVNDTPPTSGCAPQKPAGRPLTSREQAKLARLQQRLEKDAIARAERERRANAAGLQCSHCAGAAYEAGIPLNNNLHPRANPYRFYPSTAALEAHCLAKHPRLVAQSDDEDANDAAAAAAGASAASSRVECRVCDMTFPNQEALEEHFRSLTPADESYECMFCHRTLPNQRALAQHLTFKHNR